MPFPSNDLQRIHDFPDLVRYLEDELHWPLNEYSFDDLTFEYSPDEVGLRDEDAAKIRDIRQLKPIRHDQPWGIFFVEFEKKKLPVVVLRRILNHLVLKKRASAKGADAPQWASGDILFISAFGDLASGAREIAFAHFQQEAGDLPTLRVLGWDGGDTPLHIAHVASQLKTRLRWPNDPGNAKAWREEWSKPFVHRIGHIIRTSNELAEVMAQFARRIRDAARTLMAHETERGALRTLYLAFRTSLIHDLTLESFADTYAQTITYGLLTAAISRTEMSGGRHGTALLAENIADIVPVTNPFLKEMLETFLKAGGRRGGIDFDELGIQDVVALLRGDETDLPAILRDFGNRTRGEDPVIHFYENFLSAYNKQLKIQRGVFYTPRPVVSYIVRSVHELLQTEFDLQDGLADTTTWGEMIRRQPGLKLPNLSDDPGKYQPLPESEPFVQILDPATGTATFLVEVIEVIYSTLTTKWRGQQLTTEQRQAAWNDYVPKHLLPRLHAYELMMAPYAIAHMKIGLKLGETGYKFGTEERARIYLTNALEPKVTQLPQIGFDALAHEAKAVNEVKWNKRFTVVIGNPPYSSSSLNKSNWILSLLETYKKGLGERKIYLDDDFIKFFRFAHHLLVNSGGPAIMGMITNSTHLDGITQRQMRQQLMRDFQSITITNLRGNLREGESCPDGSVDENVFDILQGVAVTIAISSMKQAKDSSDVKYRDLWGLRENKYRELLETTDETWIPINPEAPRFLFVPSLYELDSEYQLGVAIPEILAAGVTGVQTKRDELVFAETSDELRDRFERFRNGSISADEIREQFGVKDIPEWKLEKALNNLMNDRAWESRITECLYRPFEIKSLFYSGSFIARDRREVMRHMLKPNIAFVITRQSNPTEPWSEFLVTNKLVEKRALASYSGEARAYPLYLIEESHFDSTPVVNVTSIAVALFHRRLGWAVDSIDDARRMFNYVYAVGYSPSFRLRYDTLIKRDYLRIPVTSSRKLAVHLARIGDELVALHLLKSSRLDKSGSELIGNRQPFVEKLSWSQDTVWIDKAQTNGFRPVPEAVWNFHVGGYQVCEKWLKDRKGCSLSPADIAHYYKIVIALGETIRLMDEIDATIEQYGGWPDAFTTVEPVSV